MAITDAIMDIARSNGYDGGNPQTISEAVNILTDTLGGERRNGLISDSVKGFAGVVPQDESNEALGPK